MNDVSGDAVRWMPAHSWIEARGLLPRRIGRIREFHCHLCLLANCCHWPLGVSGQVCKKSFIGHLIEPDMILHVAFIEEILTTQIREHMFGRMLGLVIYSIFNVIHRFSRAFIYVHTSRFLRLSCCSKPQHRFPFIARICSSLESLLLVWCFSSLLLGSQSLDWVARAGHNKENNEENSSHHMEGQRQNWHAR